MCRLSFNYFPYYPLESERFPDEIVMTFHTHYAIFALESEQSPTFQREFRRNAFRFSGRFYPKTGRFSDKIASDYYSDVRAQQKKVKMRVCFEMKCAIALK